MAVDAPRMKRFPDDLAILIVNLQQLVCTIVTASTIGGSTYRMTLFVQPRRLMNECVEHIGGETSGHE